MTSKEILQTDLIDILFENRNKSYGAYTLRKDYYYHLLLSLGITFSLIIFSILFSLTGKKIKNQLTAKIPDPVVLKQYSINSEPEPLLKKLRENLKQVKNVNRIQLVPDIPETDIPDQANIGLAVIGKDNLDGESLSESNKMISTGNETAANLFSADTLSEINFMPVETPPSFPGGIAAWLNFLKKYLQSPEELDAGQKVEVRVKFRIDKEGTLSGFEIVQSGGKLFDKEVLRVMKKMPGWIPALQNQSRVAVYYTQPVIFMGVKE